MSWISSTSSFESSGDLIINRHKLKIAFKRIWEISFGLAVIMLRGPNVPAIWMKIILEMLLTSDEFLGLNSGITVLFLMNLISFWKIIFGNPRNARRIFGQLHFKRFSFQRNSISYFLILFFITNVLIFGIWKFIFLVQFSLISFACSHF